MAPREPKLIHAQQSRLAEQIRKGEVLLETLLPCEAIATKRVTKMLKPLKREQQSLARELSGLKRVSVEPLTWRRKDGAPCLAVFHLDMPKLVLEWHDDWRSGSWAERTRLKMEWVSLDGSEKLDLKQGKKYSAIVKAYFKVMRRCGVVDEVTRLTATFEGVIPFEVREKIECYRPLFDDILIVAEPTSWKKHIPKPDPLIVGWDGREFWIIAAFDVTPVEQAMLSLAPGTESLRLKS
ncbi:MAG: hypothetical protein AAB668_03450 [Patescibacteria group bacterium]